MSVISKIASMMNSGSKEHPSSSTSNPSKPESKSPSTILVVGLGNVGSKYAGTRHNVGFLVVDALAKRSNATFSHKKRFKADIAPCHRENASTQLLLVKPTTFMNRSGEAVQEVASWQKPQRIVVIHDEVDIPFGDIRVKESGGSAGHNGIKSITESLGTDAFTRIRVGIGRPDNPRIPLEDWVLKNWSKEEKAQLPNLINRVIELIEKM